MKTLSFVTLFANNWIKISWIIDIIVYILSELRLLPSWGSLTTQVRPDYITDKVPKFKYKIRYKMFSLTGLTVSLYKEN